MSKRTYKSSAVGDLVARITKPALQKRGFTEQKLLLEWSSVVGPELARHTIPDKMVFDRHGKQAAQLHILCDPAWAMELQYLEPVLLEKIASYFGHKAVERIIIRQHPLPPAKAKAPAKPTATAPLNDTTREQLSHVADDELREALSRLAASREQANT